MKKVYTAATPAEAAEIVKTIYASGYPDRMVLQRWCRAAMTICAC